MLDLGCGDGFYTVRFWDLGSPRAMTGVDAAHSAVEVAAASRGDRPIQFLVANAHQLPYADNSFDLVLVQSILHHDHDPLGIIREAFRLAPMILIHEPNGNNIGLKIIERVSSYHREHQEKSYTPLQLKRWITKAGGICVAQRFAGFVPMFCPDWLARGMKAIESPVETIPVLRACACAVVVLVAQRSR